MIKLLEKNYNILKEIEKEINETLSDKNKKLTKDILQDFISKLNESKFIISNNSKGYKRKNPLNLHCFKFLSQ